MLENFDGAVSEALKLSKYDILTGRRPDINKLAADFFMQILSKILNSLNLQMPDMASYNTKVILYIVLAVSAVLLAVLIIFIYLYISKKRRKATEMDGIYSLLSDGSVTYEDLTRMADEYVAAGNYREACRHTFMALLYVLNVKNIIYLHKSKTNTQLITEIKNNAPIIYNPFNDIVNVFNRSWFGYKEMDAEKYLDFSLKTANAAKEARLL